MVVQGRQEYLATIRPRYAQAGREYKRRILACRAKTLAGESRSDLAWESNQNQTRV